MCVKHIRGSIFSLLLSSPSSYCIGTLGNHLLAVLSYENLRWDQPTNVGGINSVGPHEHLAKEEGIGISKCVEKAQKEATFSIPNILMGT